MLGNLSSMTQSVALLSILSMSGVAIQLALHPLYGSVAPSLYHTTSRTVVYLLSIFWPYHKFPNPENLTLLAFLACYIACLPYLTYTLGKWLARSTRDPITGASLTVVLTILPLTLSSISLLKRWNAKFLPNILSRSMFIAAINISAERLLWKYLPLGKYWTSSNLLLILNQSLVIWTALLHRRRRKGSGGRRSFKFITLVVPPVVLGILSTRLPPAASPRTPYVRQSLITTHQIIKPASTRVLARQDSITGLIQVGEYVEESFRFLRADHSLLGGRWIGAKVAHDNRNGLGDSIYSTFILQEAVRLIEPRGFNKSKEREQERALFIGLGVGIAVESFLTHGINTTVVEIDPVVYSYSRKFFGLPEPDELFLEDARVWLEKQHPLAEGEKYDYVIHDCFSGGGVPEHIFTSEFWGELRKAMKKDSAVAVNFAGTLESSSSRAIYLTLEASFGYCKAYHDHLYAFDEKQYFFNIVIFCSSAPWNFRDVREDDYLKSRLRQHMLTNVTNREVARSKIIGNLEGDEWILHDGSNNLRMWEKSTALEHWKVMREVLPDIFWETY